MNFLANLFSGSYQELWKAIIRPYRDEYTDTDLGPQRFRLNQKFYKRSDFSLINKRNLKLMCSYWEPYEEQRPCPRLPCVIYLHGNSSSRCEVVPNLKYLLPLNITVFAFDFAGCGHSEGDYISLGWYEVFDIQCVINFLRKSNKVSTIGLWGRSMGAVTSIMYASKEQSIAGIFLDSPFYSLNLLIDELSKEKVSLPNFLVRQVIKMIKQTVKEKAEFNIDDIETVEFAKICFVPAFFCHGKDDTFVNVHHCNDLFAIYPGEKNILLIEGDHNTLRPNKLNENASEFFYNALKCKYIRELNDSFNGYKLFFRDWNDPKFRTPKGDNEIKFKKKGSHRKSGENIFDNEIDESGKNNSKKFIHKSNDKSNYKNDKNEKNEKNEKYKYRHINQNNSPNNSNLKIDKNNETINYNTNYQRNNYNSKFRINDNYNDSIKKNASSTKDLYNYNTFDRPKLEQQNQIFNKLTTSKVPQHPKYFKKNLSFEDNIYKNQNNYLSQKEIRRIESQNINNINETIYNININEAIYNNNINQIYNNPSKTINYKKPNNFSKNTIQREAPFKKIQINKNKIMRPYISPQQNITYPMPIPTISNFNLTEVNGSYTYNVNNSPIKENYESFNNDDNIIYSNIFNNNENNILNYDEYNNINDIYSNSNQFDSKNQSPIY